MEVSLGIPILLIVVVAISSMTTQGINWMRINGLDSKARVVAIQELERLRTLQWTALAGMPAAPTPTTQLSASLTQAGLANATGTVAVASHDIDADGTPDPAAHARLITVTIAGYGTQRTITIASVISQNELHQP